MADEKIPLPKEKRQTFAQAKEQVVALDLHRTEDSYLNIEGYISGIRALLGYMEIDISILYGEKIIAEGERRGGKRRR